MKVSTILSSETSKEATVFSIFKLDEREYGFLVRKLAKDHSFQKLKKYIPAFFADTDVFYGDNNSLLLDYFKKHSKYHNVAKNGVAVNSSDQYMQAIHSA